MGFDSLSHDIRYSLRALRRTPLFAATVVVTMGLGLGLLGSAFTILNAYLIKPIDLPDARALYGLSWDTDATRRHRFTRLDYEALRPAARDFEDVAATQNVAVMQDGVSMPGLLVTGNYFQLLGARPAVGRLLRPEDAAVRGGEPVVVLSRRMWRSRYGSKASIVGQRIRLGRQSFEIVGVADSHAALTGQEFVSFWAPLTMAGAFPGADPWTEPNAATLGVVGRRRSEASAASVGAWLDVWLRQRFPAPSGAAPVAVRVDSLATRIPLNGATLAMFVFTMSAFGLVLLVASANITNLMLARALARQPEITLRLALGASRWRVTRQLIVESLLLAVPAAAAGLGLVIVTARVFPAAILATFPAIALPVDSIMVPLDPDWRVLAFLAVAAVLFAMLVTLAPAARLARLRLAQASRGETSADGRGSRLRAGLVAMQIGACALFLVGAVALLDESSRLANPQTNLSYERVSLVGIDRKVRAAVATRLASDPAVAGVAVAWKPPLMAGPLPTARATAPTTNIAQNIGYAGVSPEYFRLFDVAIVRGRAFTPAEAATGAPVALVSEATAAALWPGVDPLGQTLDVAALPGGPVDQRVPRGRVQVIGVTEDVVSGNIFEGLDASCVYFPVDLHGPTEMSLLMRARTDDVTAWRAAVTTAVQEIAPDTAFEVNPMRTLMSLAHWIFQAFSVTASILGVVGLLFAYSGTHAVVSFVVAQRRREFGVRMAIGASAWRIVWGMLIETFRTAAVGLAVGLALAAGLARLFNAAVPILPGFGFRPFVVGAAIVLSATLLATLAPLRAAARIDPAEALRAD